uniref:Uncharacterized protein n=1 Tax=Heterorhabditis bacteriophora TaxID=37862 RepID=A0A1I7WHF4_HETBA
MVLQISFLAVLYITNSLTIICGAEVLSGSDEKKNSGVVLLILLHL